MYSSLLTSILPLLSLASASPIISAPQPAGAILESRDSTTAGCTNTSFGRPDEFAWQIQGLDFHASWIYTTPAHQNSWGYVSFNLTNPALAPAFATCSASSDRASNFFYGDVAYTCSMPDGSVVIGGGSGGRATFDFSASGALRVNQTWKCADQDPQWPIFFTAYGAVNLTLDCQDTEWQNPNWTMGQIWYTRDRKCAPVDLPLESYQMTAIA